MEYHWWWFSFAYAGHEGQVMDRIIGKTDDKNITADDLFEFEEYIGNERSVYCCRILSFSYLGYMTEEEMGLEEE